MDNKKNQSEKMTEQEKQIIIERLWLIYYNNTLFDKGLITENQRNRMYLLIHSRPADEKKLAKKKHSTTK